LPAYTSELKSYCACTFLYSFSICKHATNTEVVDCRGHTSPRTSNSAPFLHLLQQHNPVQPTENSRNEQKLPTTCSVSSN